MIVAKCWVLMMGHGWRDDGDYGPVRVFLSEAEANEQFRILEEIRAYDGDICGESHADRQKRLAKAEVETPLKYVAIGFPEAKFGAWWELFEDIDLVGASCIT